MQVRRWLVCTFFVLLFLVNLAPSASAEVIRNDVKDIKVYSLEKLVLTKTEGTLQLTQTPVQINSSRVQVVSLHVELSEKEMRSLSGKYVILFHHEGQAKRMTGMIEKSTDGKASFVARVKFVSSEKGESGPADKLMSRL